MEVCCPGGSNVLGFQEALSPGSPLRQLSQTEKLEGARECLASLERNLAKNESSWGEARGEEGVCSGIGQSWASVPLYCVLAGEQCAGYTTSLSLTLLIRERG